MPAQGAASKVFKSRETLGNQSSVCYFLNTNFFISLFLNKKILFNAETKRGIIDSIDMRLSKLWEMVKDRKAWRAAVHGVTKSRT